MNPWCEKDRMEIKKPECCGKKWLTLFFFPFPCFSTRLMHLKSDWQGLRHSQGKRNANFCQRKMEVCCTALLSEIAKSSSLFYSGEAVKQEIANAKYGGAVLLQGETGRRIQSSEVLTRIFIFKSTSPAWNMKGKKSRHSWCEWRENKVSLEWTMNPSITNDRKCLLPFPSLFSSWFHKVISETIAKLHV